MRNPATCWIGACRRSLHGAALRSAARASLAIEQAAAVVGYVVVTFVYGMEYGGHDVRRRLLRPPGVP